MNLFVFSVEYESDKSDIYGIFEYVIAPSIVECAAHVVHRKNVKRIEIIGPCELASEAIDRVKIEDVPRG